MHLIGWLNQHPRWGCHSVGLLTWSSQAGVHQQGDATPWFDQLDLEGVHWYQAVVQRGGCSVKASYPEMVWLHAFRSKKMHCESTGVGHINVLEMRVHSIYCSGEENMGQQLVEVPKPLSVYAIYHFQQGHNSLWERKGCNLVDYSPS